MVFDKKRIFSGLFLLLILFIIFIFKINLLLILLLIVLTYYDLTNQGYRTAKGKYTLIAVGGSDE